MPLRYVRGIPPVMDLGKDGFGKIIDPAVFCGIVSNTEERKRHYSNINIPGKRCDPLIPGKSGKNRDMIKSPPQQDKGNIDCYHNNSCFRSV